MEGENKPKLTCTVLGSKAAITSLERDLIVISVKCFLTVIKKTPDNPKSNVRNSKLKTVLDSVNVLNAPISKTYGKTRKDTGKAVKNDLKYGLTKATWVWKVRRRFCGRKAQQGQ